MIRSIAFLIFWFFLNAPNVAFSCASIFKPDKYTQEVGLTPIKRQCSATCSIAAMVSGMENLASSTGQILKLSLPYLELKFLNDFVAQAAMDLSPEVYVIRLISLQGIMPESAWDPPSSFYKAGHILANLSKNPEIRSSQIAEASRNLKEAEATVSPDFLYEGKVYTPNSFFKERIPLAHYEIYSLEEGINPEYRSTSFNKNSYGNDVTFAFSVFGSLDGIKQEIKKSIDRGIGVFFAFYLEEFNFTEGVAILNSNNIASLKIHNRDTDTGHVARIAGYHIDQFGNVDWWKVQNSWGVDSGDKGFIHITDQYFDKAFQKVIILR